MGSRNLSARYLLLFLAIAAISIGFIWGGNTRFFNASSGAVFVRYTSTTGSYSGHIIRGGGLKDSTDNGELVSVTVQYEGNRTKTLSAPQVRRLKSAVADDHGVWWIDDSGITYLAGKTANIRQRKMFGHL